jgi:hypothetical protein
MIIRDTNVLSALMSRIPDQQVIACRATLATRNTSHFHDLSVPLVNPWACDKA